MSALIRLNSTLAKSLLLWVLLIDGLLAQESADTAQIADIDCTVLGSDETQQTDSKTKRRIDKISISTRAIFDESDQDSMAIHHFANWLHINTKEDVIKERLPFKEGDTLDQEDLLEAERIIRSQAYIRDAKITFKQSCNINTPAEVEIKTWDNWSLIPTVSFGRKGSENKVSFGVKEDNVLGTGIRARFKYNSDEQRSGYQFTLKSAFPMLSYSTISLDFLDNDDGQRAKIELDKPFYHLRTETMFNISYLSDEKTEDVFQNGLTRNSFNLDSHRYAISAGWQLANNGTQTTRFKYGYVDEASTFSPANVLSTEVDLFLPQDRDYQYPWVGIEYLQREFKTMSDIYLINQTEDINLGWHHEVQLGVELNDVSQDSHFGYHVKLLSSKGFEVDKDLVLLSFAAQGDFNTLNPDSYSVTATAEYFSRYSDLIGFYSRLNVATSNNVFLDNPISIGDDDGVRGYPLQYQHGAHRLVGSIEARFYTDYNILKILDLGFVAFADAGRAWSGEQAQYNEADGILSSIGLGVRLYSSRSSHKSVIHMDVAKPFNTSDNVDTWEWRLQIKQSF